MKMDLTPITILLLASATASCSATIRASYGFESLGLAHLAENDLHAVPSQVDCQGGTTGVCAVENEDLKVTWFLGPTSLGAIIENKSDRSINVDWGMSGYVEQYSTRPHGLVFKYSPEAELPRRIPAMSRQQLDLYPAGLVKVTTIYVRESWGTRVEKRVHRRQIFKNEESWSSISGDIGKGVQAQFDQMEGRKFGIVLRVEKDRMVTDYFFPFQISTVKTTRTG